MAKRAAAPFRTPPLIPMTLDEFAEACLDTVLARYRFETQRLEAGRVHRALYAAPDPATVPPTTKAPGSASV